LKLTFKNVSDLIQLINSLKLLIEKTEINALEMGILSKEKPVKEKKK
jgi:hypothetical protein